MRREEEDDSHQTDAFACSVRVMREQEGQEELIHLVRLLKVLHFPSCAKEDFSITRIIVSYNILCKS